MDDNEKEKLALEISKLRLPWYKNLEFWKIFIPTIATLLSLYFIFGQGVLDVRKEKLELQKEQLKLEILQFEQTKESIQKSIAYSSIKLDSLKIIIDYYKKRGTQLSNELKIYENKISDYEKSFNQLSVTLTKNKKYYQNELLNQYKLETKHLSEIQSLKNSFSAVYDTLIAAKTENNYLRGKFKLDKNELLDIEILKNETIINNNKARILEYDKIIKKIENNYQKEIDSLDSLSLDELIKKYELLKLKYNAR